MENVCMGIVMCGITFTVRIDDVITQYIYTCMYNNYIYTKRQKKVQK